MQLDIILYLMDKDNHDKYARYVKEHTLTKETNQILKDLDHYYTANPTVSGVSVSDFRDWFKIVQHSSWTETKLKEYDPIFDRLDSKSMPSDSAVVNHFITTDVATRIFDAAARVAEGVDTDFTPIIELVDEWKSKVDSISDTEDLPIYSMDTLDDVDEDEDGEYEWRFDPLNLSIGKVGKGHLIAVAARPDVGKTSFLAAEVSHRAQLLEEGEHILWFNNEQAVREIRDRIASTYFNVPTRDIKKDRAAWQAKMPAKIRDCIKVVDKADMSSAFVEKVIKSHNPKMIVIDRLSKITMSNLKKGLNSAQETLERAVFARELAKNYCNVLFTIWVDNFGDNVKYVEMSHLYESKTGLQGECDAVITIGKLHEEPTIKDRNNRYFYVPKNKVVNGDPAFRNGKFESRINPDVGVFEP